MVNSVVLVSFYDFYSLLFNLLFSMFALVLACLVCFLVAWLCWGWCDCCVTRVCWLLVRLACVYTLWLWFECVCGNLVAFVGVLWFAIACMINSVDYFVSFVWVCGYAVFVLFAWRV